MRCCAGAQAGKVHPIVWVILTLAVFLGVRFAQSFMAFSRQDAQLTLFKPHIESYLALTSLPAADGAPYIRGRLVTVDVDNRLVDYWTYPKLSEELRAADPARVGTVGLVSWGKKQAGGLCGGGNRSADRRGVYQHRRPDPDRRR